jgi:hypothetical protein
MQLLVIFKRCLKNQTIHVFKVTEIYAQVSEAPASANDVLAQSASADILVKKKSVSASAGIRGRLSSLLSKLLPSFKNKGERSDPSNYCPIAQTTAVEKIVEKFFAKQMDKKVYHRPIIRTRQIIIMLESTVTALFDICESIYSSLEKREKLNMILYDFSSAFGCLVPGIRWSKSFEAMVLMKHHWHGCSHF